MNELPIRNGAYVVTPPRIPDIEHETRVLCSDEVTFVHPSEQALAAILDFYGVVWEYEPHLFPIAWDDTGMPLHYFRPDFYLPRDGTYLELTTAAGATTINSKNRKLRLVREHYPNVHVRLIRRDTLAHLTRRFGLRTDAVPTGNFTTRHRVITTPLTSEGAA